MADGRLGRALRAGSDFWRRGRTGGLGPGDVIVEVDGEPARDVDALIVKTLTMRPRSHPTPDIRASRSLHTAVLTSTPGAG